MEDQMLNWKLTKNEFHVIDRLAVRASYMAKEAGAEYTVVDAQMDITCCHLNACRLRLDELASADPFNFSHDVFGIRGHLNRKTGKLEDCFLPRFAQR
jgi:hypothetical protein